MKKSAIEMTFLTRARERRKKERRKDLIPHSRVDHVLWLFISVFEKNQLDRSIKY